MQAITTIGFDVAKSVRLTAMTRGGPLVGGFCCKTLVEATGEP
jgi:hypothetical protein